MKLSFFGMYNQHYARTSTLREGLRRLGIEIHEIHEEVPNERMELPEDFTLTKTLHRILRKVACFFRLILRSAEIRGSRAIVVLHPGHMELPYAYLLAKLSRKPLLFDSSISPYDTMFVGRSIADKSSIKAKAVKMMETILLRLPDKVIVDTERMGKFMTYYLGVPKHKLCVVPLGANDTVYQPAPDVSSHTGIRVLFFGLYNPMHGAPTILEAAKQLADKSTITFTMLGDGYLKESLMHYVKVNKLKNVTFLGFMPEASLVKHIQETDIMLGIFSKSPVFERVIPNKVFAALACKKPLITANLPAVASFFTSGKDILLCPPEDSKALADAIAELAASKKKRDSIAESGYQRYLKTGTPQSVAKIFLSKTLGVKI